MFINNEGKFFGKVSIVDVLVVIVIAVLAAGIYFRLISPITRIVTTPQRIEYQMRIRAVRTPTIDALERRGAIADERTGEELGEIISAIPEPAYWTAVMLDGRVERLLIPGRQDVILTVQVDGRVNETGYLTYQNRALAVGTEIPIESKYALTTGEIISIRTMN